MALRHRIQAAAAAAAQGTQTEAFATAAQQPSAGARKQKITTSKAPKQAASSKAAREESAAERKFKLLLDVLTPEETDDAPLSAEQQAEYTQRAKAYSRAKMAEERAWQRDLTRKIKLKDAALAALPPKLREAAAQPDMTPFPLDRMVPTHTPPIKGFGDAGRGAKSGGRQ